MSELKEQSIVVNWARQQGIKVSAIAQSTYTPYWGQINKNKKSGVEKGAPDLLLVIPKHLRLSNKAKTIFIEMKKEKGGVTSKEQKAWVEALNDSDGVEARVCHGAEQAITYLQSLIEIQPPVLEGEGLENLIHNL